MSGKFDEAIAIVGVGGIFPGARSLEEFWRIIERGVDTSKPVPPERWILDPHLIQSRMAGDPDRVYTDRGCFIEDFHLDKTGLNLPPDLLNALDPSVHLLLEAGRNALAGANLKSLDRSRVGVVLGNIALPTNGASALCEQILRPLLEQTPAGPPLGASALNRYVAGLPAGLLAQALGLGGGSFTLDAACASSLYALKLACDELLAGRADAMLAGGLSRPDSLYTQMGFCQLRALSQSGRCSPFDAVGDGLLVGEGAGVLVLKRLSEALRDGDRVRAVVRGIGLSNDLDGNLLSPSSEGQLRALQQAYQQAGWTPDQVDMIECHATGTPVGDAVEFESLTKLWRGRSWRPGQCALGAVKANIGHLLTAAGGASLIKTVLALENNTLPAMANFRQPSAKIPLSGSPFRILQSSQPWARRDAATPRRAAINGFGFGGINAHVLIEEWIGPRPAPHRAVRPVPPPAAIAIVGMAATVGRWPTLQAFQERVLGGGTVELPAEREQFHSLSPQRRFPGYYLDDLAIPINRHRIPPKELEELLPQQALMLEVARAALADARARRPDPARAGVFIGLGLDLRTTDFHFRWANQAAGRAAPEARQNPPLTADRTMGALAGVNASRIAKEFHFGGPSHTVCGEDCSGIRALEIAVRALQLGELDQALAGAVELTGDLRALLATDALRPYSQNGAARPYDMEADGAIPGEGAVALVLKRLDDARRDGDRVYAVIRGLGTSSGDSRKALERAYLDAGAAPASIGFLEANGSARPEEDRAEINILDSFFAAHDRKTPCRLGCAKADVGHTGAASGLVSVLKAGLALYHEIIPPLRGLEQPISELAGSQALTAPTAPQHWLRNRADGPRRAGVHTSSIDGNFTHLVLEGYDDQVHERISRERSRPLGVFPEGLFVARAENPESLLHELQVLRAAAAAANGQPIEWTACEWSAKSGKGECALALIAQDTPQLLRLLDRADQNVRHGEAAEGNGAKEARDRDRIFYVPPQERMRGGLAFVFPGAGTYFASMGRELALHWPEILRAQDRENQSLASQMFTDRFWSSGPLGDFGTDHRPGICGQVALGAMVSDLARSFGLKPEAAIGYSLGESTALFALRAWTSRDEMLRRVSASTLFARDLTGTPENLRRVWRTPIGQAVEWRAGLVDRSAAEVRAAAAGRARIYILIVNTPDECVIGGDATEVRTLVATLGCHWYPLDGVSTVHCELFHPVQEAYRELHRFKTTAPDGVRFFSGGWGRAYVPDRETAADAIVAQASGCIDFPRVVRAAYDSGIRMFIEMGPGNSCSRMISQILEGRPHLACSLCASAQEPVLGFLRVLAQLAAYGVAVNLEKLHAAPPLQSVPDAEVRSVRIPIISPLFSSPVVRRSVPAISPAIGFEADFIMAMERSQAATLHAHKAYLDFSQGVFQSLSTAIQSQLSLTSAFSPAPPITNYAPAPEFAMPKPSRPRLDRAACLEFARGSAAKVLGSEFSPVDKFPTRVRLPDEPLMLVDRILDIEGEARSMTFGRVVTEHDVHAGAWYLDGGRIPTCIAVEAGQADLFLSGYLGIDFQTEGRAVYRLLDAKICFHRGLPGAGKVIRYDIRIVNFFQQGGTWLFRFNFEATVDGLPLLTMTDGCAGFFSAKALAGGKGVVRTAMDLKAVPGKRPADWEDFVAMEPESLTAEQLDALRDGNLEKCFGPRFAGLGLINPATLPAGLMKLVHRIPLVDPTGGQFGLGLIRGEADIHPQDWFLTCHFVDDRVMPGTLMFECCLHTLRVFLLRMGWVVEKNEAALEPVPGVVSQLKCRGQVLETTRVVTYEISIKELGYAPAPYVIADALMYADGKPIVEISNMSLRYTGVTRERFREIWRAAKKPAAKRAIYDTDRILAYAIGKPSEAFGAPYQIFDQQRRLARLPGPPYLFLDRITEVQGQPFQMTPGCSAEAQYDVPPDAWYFSENRQDAMPFAVLLEVALQPCGWLAAYAGSALTSKDADVSFRNLGGSGRQFVPVTSSTGTLTTRVKMTRVSSSAGMILQWFDLEVRSDTALVYQGDTYFGFFPQAALARQEGIQNGGLFQPAASELAQNSSLPYPSHSPYAGNQLRMVDHIEVFLPNGGPNKLGFIRATKQVNAAEWFFKAHFFQDPVMPGSLGLESLLQLLKFLAVERWGNEEHARWDAVALGQSHEWVYRGQVLPTDRLVTVEAVVTAADDQAHLLTADGFLSVDGRMIYQMKNFSIGRKSNNAPSNET